MLKRLLVVCLAVAFGVAAQGQDKPKPTFVAGKVKAIDTKSITLEGAKKKEGGEVGPDQTFAITADTKVMQGKENPKAIADVKVGAMVQVMVSQDKKNALAINLAGEKKPGEGDKPGVKKPGEGDKPGVKKPVEGEKKPVEGEKKPAENK